MMAYDPQCELLAEYFLRKYDTGLFDRITITHDLAQHIQDAIEEWFHGHERVDTP